MQKDQVGSALSVLGSSLRFGFVPPRRTVHDFFAATLPYRA